MIPVYTARCTRLPALPASSNVSHQLTSLVLPGLHSAGLISAHGVAASAAKAAFHKLVKHDLCAASQRRVNSDSQASLAPCGHVHRHRFYKAQCSSIAFFHEITRDSWDKIGSLLTLKTCLWLYHLVRFLSKGHLGHENIYSLFQKGKKEWVQYLYFLKCASLLSASFTLYQQLVPESKEKKNPKPRTYTLWQTQFPSRNICFRQPHTWQVPPLEVPWFKPE